MKNDNNHIFFFALSVANFEFAGLMLQNNNTRLGSFPCKRSLLQNPDREGTNQSARICLRLVLPYEKVNKGMFSSTRSQFRKLFSFYTLIISYMPKRGHHNVVISTKSLYRIISNSYTLKNLSKNISKLVFLDF